jgi:hypothetical protein
MRSTSKSIQKNWTLYFSIVPALPKFWTCLLGNRILLETPKSIDFHSIEIRIGGSQKLQLGANGGYVI